MNDYVSSSTTPPSPAGEPGTVPQAAAPGSQSSPYVQQPQTPYGAPPAYGTPPPGYGYAPPAYQPPPGYVYRPATRVAPEQLATVGARFLARLLDGLIQGGTFALFWVFAIASLDMLQNSSDGASVLWSLSAAFSFACALLIPPLYEILLTGRNGQTLGKKALNIKVVRTDFSPVGYGASFGRYAVAFAISFVGSFFFVAGLIDPLWALWDAERQTLHDKGAGTFVVNA